ncbi:hypothetical protein [Enterovirga sp. CN4-39]|uniref:hypothetical protein n=1 Tax=Enterovirga sp. CN4-39 TaxID=3400910 RepID=UPI003C0D3ACA
MKLGEISFAIPAAMQPSFDPGTVRTEVHPGRNPLFDYCQRADDAPAAVTRIFVAGRHLQSAPQPVPSVHLLRLSVAHGPLRLIPDAEFGPRLFVERTIVWKAARPEPGNPWLGWYRISGRTEDGLAVLFDIDRHAPQEQWDAIFRRLEAFITSLRRT